MPPKYRMSRKFEFCVSHSQKNEETVLTKLNAYNFYSYALVILVHAVRPYMKGFVYANKDRVLDTLDWLEGKHAIRPIHENGETVECKYTEEAGRPGCAILLSKGCLAETKKLYTSTKKLTFKLNVSCDTHCDTVSNWLNKLQIRSKLLIAVKNEKTISGYIYLKNNILLSTVYNTLRNWNSGISVVSIDSVPLSISDEQIKRSFLDKDGAEILFNSEFHDAFSEQHLASFEADSPAIDPFRTECQFACDTRCSDKEAEIEPGENYYDSNSVASEFTNTSQEHTEDSSDLDSSASDSDCSATDSATVASRNSTLSEDENNTHQKIQAFGTLDDDDLNAELDYLQTFRKVMKRKLMLAEKCQQLLTQYKIARRNFYKTP